MESFSSHLAGLLTRAQELSADVFLAILLLLAGVVAAFGTKGLAFSVVRRIQSGAWGSNGWMMGSASQLNRVAVAFSRVIFWATILVFFALMAEILGINVVNAWLETFGRYLPNLLAGLLIFISGFIVSGFLREFFLRALVAAGISKARGIATFGYWISITISLLLSINQIGVDIQFLTSILLVAIGSFMLCGAISFGMGSAPLATTILSTFYLRKGLKVGQVIEAHGVSGRVMAILATSVQIQTREGVVVLPTEMLTKNIYRIKQNAGI